MTSIIVRIQGLIILFGLPCFLIGYFMDINWALFLGGGLLLFDDIMDIITGVLNPLFPVILAVVLAFVFTPWYVGVFWASAVFALFDIPTSLKKVFTKY